MSARLGYLAILNRQVLVQFYCYIFFAKGPSCDAYTYLVGSFLHQVVEIFQFLIFTSMMFGPGNNSIPQSLQDYAVKNRTQDTNVKVRGPGAGAIPGAVSLHS